ncbi:hypothetical protein KEM52_002756, partial [Ascosphaera acerosa]
MPYPRSRSNNTSDINNVNNANNTTDLDAATRTDYYDSSTRTRGGGGGGGGLDGDRFVSYTTAESDDFEYADADVDADLHSPLRPQQRERERHRAAAMRLMPPRGSDVSASYRTADRLRGRNDAYVYPEDYDIEEEPSILPGPEEYVMVTAGRDPPAPPSAWTSRPSCMAAPDAGSGVLAHAHAHARLGPAAVANASPPQTSPLNGTAQPVAPSLVLHR